LIAEKAAHHALTLLRMTMSSVSSNVSTDLDGFTLTWKSACTFARLVAATGAVYVNVAAALS